MVIGILQVKLSIDWAMSLKDKRSVVSSIKDKLHREHMVSVAEVDMQDDARSAMLGIVWAGTDVAQCQSLLDRIVDKLQVHKDCVLEDHNIEILTGQ